MPWSLPRLLPDLGLSKAYEFARGLKDINDRVALNAAVIDLQEKILSAQEAASDAKARMQVMWSELDSYEKWDQFRHVTR